MIDGLAGGAGADREETRALEATGAVHRWHRLTGLVEIELAALHRQLDATGG